jgi:hypothetical protein
VRRQPLEVLLALGISIISSASFSGAEAVE